MSIFEVISLNKRFGGLWALRDVSFQTQKGEILGIIGPNGAGKTTLFNLITGFIPSTSGQVLYKNANISGKRPDEISTLGITRTFQITQPFMDLNVIDNVMIGAFLRTNSTFQAGTRAEQFIEAVGLSQRKKVRAKYLNIIERKRLEIAKAISTEPQILLLDEVMAGLRPHEIQEAIELIMKLRNQGITFLVIEHVMKVIMSISDRILVLHHGEVISIGTVEEVTNNPQVIEAYLGEDKYLA
jgi:branched-chain amino acid transport system ATP-binding protein